MNLLLQRPAGIRQIQHESRLLWLAGSILLCPFLGGNTAFAQTKVWDKSFGGVKYEHPSEDGDYIDGRNGYSYGTVMLASADGGYIIAGNSDSNVGGDKSEAGPGDYYWPDNQGYWLGNQDFWIVKMNTQGEKVWEKTLLTDSSEEKVGAMINTPDGGYLLTGHSYYKGWAVKTDGQGNVEWQKSFFGEGNNNSSQFTSAAVTADGGFLLGGYSNEDSGRSKSEPSRGSFDYWILKIDKNGNKLWDKTIGGTGQDYLSSMIPGSDGGFLLGGTSNSPASGEKSTRSYANDFWLVKIDSTGEIRWDKTIGGTGADALSTMLASEDGGYVLGGTSTSQKSRDKSENARDNNSYKGDYWIVKTDPDGGIVWDKTLGGDSKDELSSMVATADGGYLLGGTSRSAATGEKSEVSRDPGFEKADFWVIKVNSLGTKLWDKTLGGSTIDHLSGILPVSGGSYMLGGYSDSEPGNDKSAALKGYTDYWVVQISEDPLPVTLSAFSAKKEGLGAVLYWSTTSETQSDRFDVEHSINGKSWKTLGTVAAQGERKGLSQYQFVHSSPATGEENFYRLKMTDADESHTYSKICSIVLDAAFAMYPNPVSETLHVQTGNTGKVQHIQLLNSSSVPVYSSGKNFSGKMDVSKLDAGIYILKVTHTDGSFQSNRVVITK
ncbi:T9SS type A sorting domain-containing protein [Dyadobacter sediminis]|nr:T9SS type A sorting domain-containing protein [Dyadobacter sediminis]